MYLCQVYRMRKESVIFYQPKVLYLLFFFLTVYSKRSIVQYDMVREKAENEQAAPCMAERRSPSHCWKSLRQISRRRHQEYVKHSNTTVSVVNFFS